VGSNILALQQAARASSHFQSAPEFRYKGRMGLFDFFRRAPAIRTVAELADFVDRNSAFVAQKGIYDYARARAGHYTKVLFTEPEFQEACNVARWQTYPLALAMVGELVEGLLRPAWQKDRASLNDAVRELTLSVFDRYPAPNSLTREHWTQLRDELDRHLKQISLHPTKLAIDVPEPFWQRYFDLMPIHEQLRTRDELTTRGYLRSTLCNIHEELTKRMDTPALIRALEGIGAPFGAAAT
jgi:hypothetical protein